MTNKIYKNGSLPFVIDAYDQSVYDSKIIFSTQDVGTARLVFKLRKDGMPLPLSAVEGKLVLLFSNGSKHIRNISLLDKVEGIAEYILNDEEIKLYGNVQASLNLFYSNGQSLSVHEFRFSIKKNLIDENIVPAAEYYIDHFDSLKSKIEQKATELETDIKNRTDVMQGNIDDTTKELQEQLDHLKEKIDDLESLETKKGAQDKADGALKKAKEFVSGFQQKKITSDTGMPLISIKDTSVSILDAVINNGLGQGTFYAIAGSKDLPNHRSFRGFFHITDATNGKGTFGWVYATDYINNIYTNYLNNNAWSGWSRLSNHNLLSETGTRQLIATGTDILTLPSGFYYAVGTNVKNMPSSTDSSWFNIDVIETGFKRKSFHVIRSGDNLHWWGTVHTDGLFKGWKRMLTDADANTTYKFPTILNGWKTYKSEVNNDYRVRYTKDALGWVHISGAIAGGTLGDVPAFVLDEGYRPAAPLYNVGLASSTGGASGPQICRQYITPDGRYCIQMTSSNTEFIVVNFSFKV